MIRRRAYSPWHIRRWIRFAIFRLRHPEVITEGFVFLGKRVTIQARTGYGRLILGAWVHVGDDTAIRCHEGTMRIGEKCVFGADVTVNGYLDVEFGAGVLIADDVYVSDFDHRTDDASRPIRHQGIVTAPVRIGPDVWLGTKSVVTRGVQIGRGAVVGAASVVTRDLPPYAVAVGAPARVVGTRLASGPDARRTARARGGQTAR